MKAMGFGVESQLFLLLERYPKMSSLLEEARSQDDGRVRLLASGSPS